MNSSGGDKRKKELLEAKSSNTKDLKLGSDRTKERVLTLMASGSGDSKTGKKGLNFLISVIRWMVLLLGSI